MKLDDLDLPNARIAGDYPTKKTAQYPYPFCDENEMEEMGLGMRTVMVAGTCYTTAEHDALEQACESAGEKKLYFPSANDETDDRYYKVKTDVVQWVPATASVWPYTFTCWANDPRKYDADTDEVLW